MSHRSHTERRPSIHTNEACIVPLPARNHALALRPILLLGVLLLLLLVTLLIFVVGVPAKVLPRSSRLSRSVQVDSVYGVFVVAAAPPYFSVALRMMNDELSKYAANYVLKFFRNY